MTAAQATKKAAGPPLVRVIIICAAGEGTDAVRSIGSGLLGLTPEELMKTPLSPTGELPATHWVCKNYFPESVAEKMKSHPIRHGTEIVYGGEGTTADLLARRGLRRIHADSHRKT